MANLGEIKLALKIGVGAAINDAQSAEQPVQILDFLAGVAGFGVLIGGWTPQVPTVKKGGVWADSSVSDGRELTAASMGNVVETITLTSIGADMKGRYYLQKELRRYAQMARDFWQTDYQIEPVYLEWWAEGSCAPQYALVYNLDIANQQEAFSAVNVGQVVITVEREPYWRAVRPGGHPKEYTFYMRGFLPGVDWTVADLDMDDTTDNFGDIIFSNEHSWSVGKTAHGLQNWLDVPSDLIPGDVPSLCYFAFTNETYNPGNLYIARSTKPLSLPVRTGQTAYTPGLNNATFNAGDGTVGTDAAIVAATANDGRIQASSQALRKVDISFATDATLGTARLTWNGDLTIAAGGEPLSYALQRGRFMAFIQFERTGNTSVFTTLFQIRAAGDTLFTGVTQTLAASYTGDFRYMGTVDIPPTPTRVTPAFNGSGIEVGLPTSFDITIYAGRSNGADTLTIISMMLVPIDECTVYFDTFPTEAVHLDATGYLTHGTTDVVGASRTSGSESYGDFAEIRGDMIELKPGFDNRLYFFDPGQNESGEQLNAHLNIVPRWSGARDDCSPLDANGMYGGLAALSDDSDLILLDDSGMILLNG